MGFYRQGYCSGLPFPPSGDLPARGIEPECLASPALAGRFFTTELLGKPHTFYHLILIRDISESIGHCVFHLHSMVVPFERAPEHQKMCVWGASNVREKGPLHFRRRRESS